MPEVTNVRRRTRRRSAALAVAALATMGLAACGSSSTSSDGTASRVAGTGTAGAAADVAAARRRLEPFLSVPTKLDSALTPLRVRPQAGKKLIFLRCDAPDCKTIEDAARAGAQALGWTLDAIPFNTANPATLLSAMDQALQAKPDGVFVVGLPYEVWAGKVAAYRAAKVPIIAMFGGPNLKFDDTVVADLSRTTTQDYHPLLSDWIIQDSGGKSRTLIVNTPELGNLAPITPLLEARFAKNCGGCSTVKLDLTLAQIGKGQAVSAIVSALQRDPRINYVQVVNGPFANGLGPALTTAGMRSRIKIVEGNPDTTGLADVKTGGIAATVPFGKRILGWLSIDAFARYFEGMPMPNGGAGGKVPGQVLDRANITTGDMTAQGDVPANYPALFSTLWRVG